MARLLVLVLGFAAVFLLNTVTANEAIQKPGEDVALQCTDKKVVVPEYVRYQNSDVRVGKDCVLDKVRVDIITNCFNKPACSVHVSLATDCDRGTDDIVVKYECVSGTKLVKACEGPEQVSGDFLPFYWFSPNYPLSYNQNDACFITVNSDSNKIYRVSILDMELEWRTGSPGCYDTFIIENQQQLAHTYTYCGTITAVKTGEALVKDMQHLKMKFSSDGQTHMRGLLIKVEESSSTTTTTTTTTSTTTTMTTTTTTTTAAPGVSILTTRPTKATETTKQTPTAENVTVPSFDDCASSPCQNNGTCVDEFGFFFCTCVLGFSGYNCEIVLNATFDQCDYEPCFHGGTCIDDFETFRCVCRDGYDGPRCEDLVELSSASRPVTGITVLILSALTVLLHMSS